MMMDRRTFILRTTLVGTAPAFANLLLLPPAAQSRAALQRGALPPQPGRDGTNSNQTVFVIDGWDCCDKTVSDNQVSIKINQSWRTAWR